MEIRSFLATCLLVDDFKRSLNFYTNILGFKINEHDGLFADFKIGDSTLAIYEKNAATAMLPKKYMKQGGGSNLAFTLKDLDKACKELTQKGITIVEGPKTTAWGQKVAYILDPDDNIIELSEK